MIRYDLRAVEMGALDAAMEAAGLVSDGVTVLLDVIGTVYAAPGEAVPGWHANLYTAEPLTAEQEAVLPIIPTPDAPVRILAGEQL